jgi:hypothetical protein
MKSSLIPLLCLPLVACLAPAATTVVNLNGAFNTVSGPGVMNAAGGLVHSFGSTTSFGISDIGGVARDVLSFNAVASATQGLDFVHGSTSPTTTGYSLLMDVYFPSIPDYVSLAQLDNNGDGDVFGRSTGAIGISGDYAGTSLTSGAWHRVVITLDIPTTTLTAFVNGTAINDVGGLSADRFDIGAPNILIFGDNDGETANGYISQFAFIDRPLNASEVLGLGSATAAPVPEPAGALLLALAGVTGLLRRRR